MSEPAPEPVSIVPMSIVPVSIIIAPGRVPVSPDRLGEGPIDATPTRGMVLATLFMVTGVLGVPLLWRCPEFSRLGRWTLVVTAHTVALFALAFWLVRWSVGEITLPAATR